MADQLQEDDVAHPPPEAFAERYRNFIREQIIFADPEVREDLAESTIGDRIKWAIDRLSEAYPGEFSLRKVAARSQLSAQALWAIVKNHTKRPTAESVENIAHALGLPIRWVLMGRAPTPEQVAQEVTERDLPSGLITFLRKPEHLPYIRAAINLAQEAVDEGLPASVLAQAGRLAKEAHRGIEAETASDDEASS